MTLFSRSLSVFCLTFRDLTDLNKTPVTWKKKNRFGFAFLSRLSWKPGQNLSDSENRNLLLMPQLGCVIPPSASTHPRLDRCKSNRECLLPWFQVTLPSVIFTEEPRNPDILSWLFHIAVMISHDARTYGRTYHKQQSACESHHHSANWNIPTSARHSLWRLCCCQFLESPDVNRVLDFIKNSISCIFIGCSSQTIDSHNNHENIVIWFQFVLCSQVHFSKWTITSTRLSSHFLKIFNP